LPAALDLAGFNGGYRVAPLFRSENLIEPGRPMRTPSARISMEGPSALERKAGTKKASERKVIIGTES